MKINHCLQYINKLKVKYVLVLLSFLVFGITNAQTTSNFSGVWIQDSTKSDDFYKSFNITCTIKQTEQEISISNDFFSKAGEKITTRADSYKLDGKETSVEEQGGINKKSAKWSADKNSLTITNTRTVGNEVYGSYTDYTLSANGKILTVVTTDANPLTGLKVTQIFNKK